MKKNLTALLTTAVVTGLLTAQVAQAEDHGADASGDHATAESNSCNGKAEGKGNSCKGAAAKKDKKAKDKNNACKGSSCGQKKPKDH